MLKRFLPPGLAALLLGSAAFFATGATSAPAGPGAVLSMHQQLFRALDAGDAKTVASLLADHPSGATWTPADSWGSARGFLVYASDAKGRAVVAEQADAGAELLESWAGTGSTTTIERAWTDCQSAELSFGVFDIARTRIEGGVSTTQRFRLTSLVSYDSKAGGWRAWHLHLSPAN